MNIDVLVPAALTFVTELDRAYPHRGRESDGSLASAEHSSANPTSDHEHGTPQPGDRDVDAVDIDSDLIPADPDASRRAMYGDVLPRFQAHPGTRYWIHNDQIAYRSEGWIPRSYAYAGPGRNRHTHHAHLNWEEDSASHNNTSLYGLKGIDDMEAVDVWSYDPGLDANGTVKKGGIPNPRKSEKEGNPTISPNTALFRAAVVHDVVIEDSKVIKQIRDAVTAPPAAQPIVLDDRTRGAIVAEVAAAVRAELPALVAQALQGIEYGPRKNTP